MFADATALHDPLTADGKLKYEAPFLGTAKLHGVVLIAGSTNRVVDFTLRRIRRILVGRLGRLPSSTDV